MQESSSTIVFRSINTSNTSVIFKHKKMKASRIIVIAISVLTRTLSLEAQVAEIPFELEDNGHTILKVKVNDISEVLNFVFDTGAMTDLLNASVAEKMGLKANYQQPVSGGGGTKTYDFILSQKLVLQNNIEVENTNILITDLTQLSSIADRDIDGVMGYSLLKDYFTKIDYDSKKLLLYEKMEDIDLTGYKAIPFQFKNGITIPQFDVSMTLNNGEKFTGLVLFDSGAGSFTLWINTPFSRTNQLSKKAVKSIITQSQNLTKKSSLEEIAIKSVDIAGFTLEELTVFLSDDELGVSSYEGYLGLLGAGIIKRFNVILDYDAKTLYLKPNKNFKSNFVFPSSGIRLKRADNKILIYSVDKTTPAYKMGIREGNEIISVDGDISGSLKIYNRLLRREGAEVSLKILHADGEIKTHKLKLMRLL